MSRGERLALIRVVVGGRALTDILVFELQIPTQFSQFACNL